MSVKQTKTDGVIEVPANIGSNATLAKLVNLDQISAKAAEAYNGSEVKAAEAEKGTWNVYGPIMPASLFTFLDDGELNVTTAQSLRDVLAEMDDEDKTLTMRIHSPGGVWLEATAMMTLLDEFRSNGGEVHAVVEGLAASAAAILAAGADKVSIGKQASMMIHNAHGAATGNAADFRDYADQLDASDNQQKSVLNERMKLKDEELNELLAAETWYRGQEAIDAGLADELVAPKTKATKAEAKRDDVIGKRSLRALEAFLTTGV